MKANKYLLLYSTSLYLIIFLCVISFYFFNPFSNSCIKGNCKNGYGTYVYSSGMRYEGEWKNGKRDGQGTLTYTDGSKYTGGWKNNRMHGEGIKTYASKHLSMEYIGEWKNGNKDGKGTAIYSDTSRYDGEWKDGTIHGYGTLIDKTGKITAGEWENEMLHGTSTVIFPDGRILVVEIKNGKKNGRGTLTFPDGTKITEEWINNKLVGSLKFYLFLGFEFEKYYDITNLCTAIKADISPSLNAPENTIPWLNELLKKPNLYEEFNKKIKASGFSQEIDTLIERTKDLRNKRFSELNLDSQIDIVKLNRLLLEHYYPDITPKTSSLSQDYRKYARYPFNVGVA
jgi:hypothetical protein